MSQDRQRQYNEAIQRYFMLISEAEDLAKHDLKYSSSEYFYAAKQARDEAEMIRGK